MNENLERAISLMTDSLSDIRIALSKAIDAGNEKQISNLTGRMVDMSRAITNAVKATEKPDLDRIVELMAKVSEQSMANHDALSNRKGE